MKKIQYIAPSLKVANIKTQNILAGSNLGVNSNPLTSNEEGFQRGAKGGSFFDDEEEEE